MKSLRNRILTVVAVGLLSIGFGASASQAQSIYKGSFTLDRSIRWQNSTMPAGDYTFTIASTTRSTPITVTGPDGTVFQLPIVVDNTKITEKSVLKVEWRGGDMYVREMDLGQPQRVEAKPVGLDRFGHQLAVARGRVLRVRGGQLVEEVEFHPIHPIFNIRRAPRRVRDGRPASRGTIR